MKQKMTTFDVVLIALLVLLCVVTLYPVLYVIFSSVSDPILLEQQSGIMLWPLGFSLDAYKLVLQTSSIAIGYRNSIFYVVAGTSINMFLTILGAYVLSRKGLYMKKAFAILIIFTMQFNGGLIPTYVVVTNLLGNSIWTMLLPSAVNVTNLIILRTGFESIPDSLEEAAKIDGANALTVLTRVILPLTKPTLAVVALYYGVSHWNQWLPAAMYLRDRNLYPLQLFLREILIQNSTEELLVNASGVLLADMSTVVKYATIIVAIVPVICIYPFLQKYFVKGTMAGAEKG